jgi:hypothetical protein
MAKRTTKRSIKKEEVKPFDLSRVNPHGRVDVLVANLIDQIVATRLPELSPIVSEKREVIHASLNERLGPHVIPTDWIDKLSPFMPMIVAAGVGVIKQYQQMSLQGKPASTDKEGVAA